MVQVRTQANMEIFIPHSKLMQERFTNWTYNSGLVRLSSDIRIEYKDALSVNLKEIIVNAVMQSKNIIAIPEPQLLLLKIEDNIISYEVNFWINVQDVDRRSALSEVNNLIINALKLHDIPLATPTIKYIKI
jgi:small-conductance mechanosensitive channel